MGGQIRAGDDETREAACAEWVSFLVDSAFSRSVATESSRLRRWAATAVRFLDRGGRFLDHHEAVATANMKGMVTDEEMRQVIDTATNFILAFLREANAHAVNEKGARIHVSGTLAFLAR